LNWLTLTDFCCSQTLRFVVSDYTTIAIPGLREFLFKFSSTRFLESLLSLEELRLEGPMILSNETLDRLIPSPDGAFACPNLKILHLDGLLCSPDRLAALIERRQGTVAGVRPLALVYVNCTVYGDQGEGDNPGNGIDVVAPGINSVGYIDWKFGVTVRNDGK
jgi:hypothetical protein